MIWVIASNAEPMLSNMYDTNIREAAFAGKFYPGKKAELEMLIQSIFNSEHELIDVSLSEKRLIGAVVPHAGYVYSGYQAVHVFELLKISKQKIDTFVIVNPNHTGAGQGNYNLCSASEWATPLGNVPADVELMNELGIDYYDTAHLNEHSGEVLLPMLQFFVPTPFKIVMITMNRQTNESASTLAQKIFKSIEKLQRNVVLLASSDFSHFETPEIGFEKDQLVIDQIIAMNTQKIYDEVQKHKVSVCGFGPVMTLIEYAKLCAKAPNMKLLKRGHSGEVYPSTKVVDYVSFLCYE